LSPGQVIHYTVTVTQQGSAEADATFTDDLSDVLDDATYNDDVTASIGTPTVSGDILTWSGKLPVGGDAVVTYSVTVHGAGDLPGSNDDLQNPVTSPGCEVVDGATVGCSTDHLVGWFTYYKTADPASGTAVSPGQNIAYTIAIIQHGTAALKNASVTDDMSDVLDDASYNDDVRATSGEASVAAPTLSWSGDLAVGQTVKVSYTVTVHGAAALTGSNDELVNPVTSTDKRGSCDKSEGCKTDHRVDLASHPASLEVGSSGLGSLAHTGSDLEGLLVSAGVLFAVGAMLLVLVMRRRRWDT
jgi:uncharacterized repeat protein (TIGR01451 family)